MGSALTVSRIILIPNIYWERSELNLLAAAWQIVSMTHPELTDIVTRHESWVDVSCTAYKYTKIKVVALTCFNLLAHMQSLHDSFITVVG